MDWQLATPPVGHVVWVRKGESVPQESATIPPLAAAVTRILGALPSRSGRELKEWASERRSTLELIAGLAVANGRMSREEHARVMAGLWTAIGA